MAIAAPTACTMEGGSSGSQRRDASRGGYGEEVRVIDAATSASFGST